jgi:hypothetical protein
MPVDYLHKARGNGQGEIEMAEMGYGGMTRVDLEWSIEGSDGTKTGKLYQLHEQELANAKRALKQRAKCGDTITVREI